MAEEEKLSRLDTLLAEWDRDAKIDKLELGDASLDGARLHAKWLRIRAYERLRLHKLKTEAAQLRKDKYEFFVQGPTKETQEKGWEHPSRGIIIKSDVPLYMDADKQVIDMNLRVAMQTEIVEAVELIFVALKGRGFDIGRKLEDMKIKIGNG